MQRRGFTLIELLVVISIMGMLSSIILASLQGARDKGRIAAGLKFATHNYHVFGADAMFIWDFDSTTPCTLTGGVCVTDIAGNSVGLQPSSGGTYQNISNATYVSNYSTTVTPTGRGRAGLIDSNHYFGAGQNLSNNTFKANLRPKSLTISAWIYPTSLTYGVLTEMSAYNAGSNDDVVYFSIQNNNYSCFSVISNTTVYVARNLENNKWHHIACSIDSNSGVSTLFYDGVQVAKVVYPGNPSFYDSNGPITDITVGTEFLQTPTFTGYIDDFAFYSSALAESDIQRIYAAGLPEHPLAKK